jgi:hypothetical protein
MYELTLNMGLLLNRINSQILVFSSKKLFLNHRLHSILAFALARRIVKVRVALLTSNANDALDLLKTELALELARLDRFRQLLIDFFGGFNSSASNSVN